MSAEDFRPSEVAYREVEEAAAQGATVTHFNAEQFPFPLSVHGRREALLEVFGEDADVINMGGGNFTVVVPAVIKDIRDKLDQEKWLEGVFAVSPA